MADDIGEALDLLVGFAQVGGALGDDALEVGVTLFEGRPRALALHQRSPEEEYRQRADSHKEPEGQKAQNQQRQLQSIGVVRPFVEQIGFDRRACVRRCRAGFPCAVGQHLP